VIENCFLEKSESSLSDASVCYLKVRLQPGSKESKFSGYHDEAELKIRIKAAPVDGAANEMLITFLKDVLSLKSSEVQIVKGLKSRSKVVAIEKSKNHVIQTLRNTLSL